MKAEGGGAGGSLLTADQTSFIPIFLTQVGLPASHMAFTSSKAVRGEETTLLLMSGDESPDSSPVFSDTSQWGEGSLIYPGEGFGLGTPLGLDRCG